MDYIKFYLNMSFSEFLTKLYGLGNDLVLNTFLQIMFVLVVPTLLNVFEGLTGIEISGKFVNTGTITSSGIVNVATGSLSNHGEISGENVNLDLGKFDNFGTIDADDKVDIDVDNGINNGIILAGTEQISANEITAPTLSTLSTESMIVTTQSTAQTTMLATHLASSTETFNLSHFLIFLLVFFKIKL